MAFGGKADREWLEPLTDEGSINKEHPDLGRPLGCHRGAHEWLNIYSPQPGFTYVWERKKPNDLRRALMKGGQIVKDDDPEMSAARAASGEMDFTTSIDSMAEYNELALVRYPESAIRKIREKESRRREAMMRGSAQSFLDKVTSAERSAEWNSRGVSTRFVTTKHSIEQDADGTVVDHWSPKGSKENSADS